MTPETPAREDWRELAVRLRAAAAEAGQAARRPPLSGAEALLEPLGKISDCLEQAAQWLRGGNREGIEAFGQELQQWAEDLPALSAWLEASSALAAGWAAAAGVSPGYGPGGDRRREAGPGCVSHCG